jgi:methyl-accepting chemotaxis protein
MSSLNNMKIGRRLGLGFGVILFFLVVLIGVGFYSLALIDEKLERIVQVNNAKIRAASEIDDSLNKIRHPSPLLRFQETQRQGLR